MGKKTENVPVLRHSYYMVNMRFICLYVNIHTFSQYRDKHTIWYKWGGYVWMLPFTHFIGNKTHILYGKIKD